MVQPSILKSHRHSKMIETHFYRLYSIIHRCISVKSMTPNFVIIDFQFVVIVVRVCDICAFVLHYYVQLLTNGCEYISVVGIRT